MADSQLHVPMANGTGTADSQHTDPPPQLTARQVELITSSWQLIGGDLETPGLILFHKLFEIAPDLKKLFPFKDQELSDDNELLKKHAIQVMESIDLAIGMLDTPDELKETLITLGIVHNMKSVQLESFGPVGEALIYTLQMGLKDKFTKEAATAWVTLYAIVQHYMTEGMVCGLSA